MDNLDHLYDTIKDRLVKPPKGAVFVPDPANVSYNSSNPKALAYRNQAVKECDGMKEECYKRILLDIYMKTLPLDDDYVAGNRGMCQDDVAASLDNKGTTATQYFKSAYAETKAPLLEYVIRSVNSVGKQFMEKAEETRKEAEEKGMDVPPPKVEEEDIDSSVVDVTDDIEYDDFIDVLKKKTINKIVNDISELIDDKSDEKDMTFTPATESTDFNVALEYISEKAIKSNSEFNCANDEMIGLAIRESTLFTIDRVFGQNNGDLKQFGTKLRLGKGIIINESSVMESFDTYTESKINNARSLTPEEKEIADKRFGKVSCSIMHCDSGYFAKTHRARTKFYPTLEELPKDKVNFISSTS